ncbi:MAG: methyltransferase domain-containing protein [Reyranella sp.]|nr:methyltransferase domain-containing protein [Reyranella sp.]
MIRPSANLDSSSYEFAYDSLRALAAELPSKVVFDIGAGDERMRRVEELGFEWHGFDLKPRKEATPWDLNDPCPSNLTPGAVMLLDVIEHCLNPGVALRNIAAVLPAGARIVVTVPNPGWSRSRIDVLLKAFRPASRNRISTTTTTSSRRGRTSWKRCCATSGSSWRST